MEEIIKTINKIDNLTKQLADEIALRETAEIVANMGSWRWEVESGRTIWTRQFRRMLGVADDIEPSAELGMTFIHPDDQERAAQAVQDVLSGNSDSYRIRKRIVPKNGPMYEVLSIGRVELKDGEVFAITGCFQNIEAMREEIRNL